MALWLLIRPRTLPLTLGVVLAAHALAAAMGAFAWLPFALSLLTVLLLQILSNIANDYGDALRGTDANRSQNAPTRAVASGQLNAAAVRRWLMATTLAATASGVALLLVVCMAGAIGWCFCCWARWRLRQRWHTPWGGDRIVIALWAKWRCF
ncbi:MAG: UbiA family prenyltransferase [Kingella oralis]